MATANAINQQSRFEDGYREAVFSVSDLELHRRFYEKVAGWQVLARDPTPRALLDAYELEASVHAEEIVLGCPGTDRGFIRLIQFDGAPQRQIRSNARSWDTGGFYDVNVRVVDMATKFRDFQRHHWQGETDPLEFTFGPFVIQEWLARGPDGIVIALVQRISPPLEGAPEFEEVGPLFNATQIVADLDAAKRFYVETLGFKTYFDDVWLSEEPEPTVLGMPPELATTVPRKVTIVHPHGTNSGSLELLEFDGITGVDCASHAMPPNLGILTLRYPLRALDDFLVHLEHSRVEILFGPVVVEMPPYGAVRLLGIRGPGGVLLECFEELADD